MAETHWTELDGRELRFRDQTWALTGDVDVRQSGDLLAVKATRVDGVRHETATLYFGLDDPPASLNPGNLGEHFDHLETEDGQQTLVVRKDPRTYRYRLQRLTYA